MGYLNHQEYLRWHPKVFHSFHFSFTLKWYRSGARMFLHILNYMLYTVYTYRLSIHILSIYDTIYWYMVKCTHTHVHKALKVCYSTAICKNSWCQFGKTHEFCCFQSSHIWRVTGLKFSGQWHGSKPFWTLGHGTRSSILADTIPSLSLTWGKKNVA